jgi:hypothetical protein
MAKIKQVNTLLKLLHLYLHLLLYFVTKKTTTERMPLCDLDPPFFAKNNRKKKEILLALLCTEEYCFKKKHTMNRKPLIMMY